MKKGLSCSARGEDNPFLLVDGYGFISIGWI